MESNRLPQDLDTLLAMAEEIAELAGERMSRVGQDAQPEALLRASIAAAIFARSAYRAMLDGAKESPLARRFVVPARNRRDHAEEQLRRRLAAVLHQIRLLLDNDDLSQVTEFVLSITA